MRCSRFVYVGFCLILALALLAFPLKSFAASDPTADEGLYSPVIITEIQTGSSATGGGSNEFVELYNTSDEAVDISNWALKYVKTDDEVYSVTTITSQTGEAVVLASHEYYVLHSSTILASSLNGAKEQAYMARLSKDDKSVLLLAPDEATCKYVVQDAVAWGSGTKPEGQAAKVSGTNNERLVQRRVDDGGNYVDANNNDHDFLVGDVTTGSPTYLAKGATPGEVNSALLGDLGDPDTTSEAAVDLAVKECVVQQPDQTQDDGEGGGVLTQPTDTPPVAGEGETIATGASSILPHIPDSDYGLDAPQISEVLPNPASPQTDANDEFIELYNSNGAPFDLSGFILETGLTTKHRYTIPSGTIMAPGQFRAFFSADTELSLSNTSGQARLLDPQGNVLAQTEQYSNAKDGQTWILAAGVWKWTTVPTPNAPNVLGEPVVARKRTAVAAKSTSSKKASGVKSASTKSSAKKKSTAKTGATDATNVAAVEPKGGIHPGILAAVGVFAVLYGAYEYRYDLANRISHIRRNRAAGRSAGRGPEGR